jgi:hypothetical protein
MSIYTKEQQTRTITNEKTGKTKTFKSTGVDAKGKHFFTSSDNAKQREFATGQKPSLKTGIPLTKSMANKLFGDSNKKTGKTKTGSGKATGTSPTAGRDIRSKQFIGKKLNMGGVMKNRGGTFKGTF